MRTRGQILRAALGRVFPDCVGQAQAVAFNMFLAFFPMLLFAFGVLSTSDWLKGEVQDMVQRLRVILPPGSDRLVVEYLVRKGPHPWRWVFLGLGGTLFAGTQVMIGLMDGFRIITREKLRLGFLARQARALFLLCLTIAPWLAVVVLSVFGRQVRGWAILEFGLPDLVRKISTVLYLAAVLLLALAVLVVVYRVGRPGHRGWKNILPGAALATVFWWLVDVSFGWYVRHMPYSTVYGGLTAAIGLLLWMYLSAMVVFLGAAYNSEYRPRASAGAGSP